MANIVASAASSFCLDLHLFVRDFDVPEVSQKGDWFEDRIIRYFRSDEKKYEVKNISGDMELLDISAASGIRHETDLLIECDDVLFLFEAKFGKSVARNDLLIFNQKCIDYWIRFVQLDEIRPLYRVFVSKTNLEYPLREFAYMWNIIVIEPELLPIPAILGVLNSHSKCKALEIYAANSHMQYLKKCCRDMRSLIKRGRSTKKGRSNMQVICLDTEDILCKGSRSLSSERFYLKHRLLSKRILKQYYNRASDDYDTMINNIESKIGYTVNGKAKK